MPRPKTNLTSADIDVEIARLTREQEQRVAALKERRHHVETAENLRRGQLLQSYLAGVHGPEIRRVLARAVGRRDRALFGINDEDAGETRSLAGDRKRQSGDAAAQEPVRTSTSVELR